MKLSNPLKGFKTKDEAKFLSRLFQLMKGGVVYADAPDLLDPVGFPQSLIDDEYLLSNPYWKVTDVDSFREILRRDSAPIPHDLNREGYWEGDDRGYWMSGYMDYRKTLEVIEKHACASGRLLDFGGSTGRVFRHFAFQSPDWDVWSCDFNPTSLLFNQKHFPASVKPFLNSANPSLPLADGEFDLVTAYSVFTHIGRSETAWLLELRRILRVGGIAYLSVHDSNTWKNPPEGMRSVIRQFRPDLLRLTELPPGRTSVEFDFHPSGCLVLHHEEYIRKNWGRYFRILEIRPLWMGQHAVVVCQKV